MTVFIFLSKWNWTNVIKSIWVIIILCFEWSFSAEWVYIHKVTQTNSRGQKDQGLVWRIDHWRTDLSTIFIQMNDGNVLYPVDWHALNTNFNECSIFILSENSCQYSTKIMGTEMFDLSWYRQYWLLAIAQQWSASLHVFESLQWITSIRMNVPIHSHQTQSITWWRPKYKSTKFKLWFCRVFIYHTHT